jgi:hypothetical protein
MIYPYSKKGSVVLHKPSGRYYELAVDAHQSQATISVFEVTNEFICLDDHARRFCFRKVDMSVIQEVPTSEFDSLKIEVWYHFEYFNHKVTLLTYRTIECLEYKSALYLEGSLVEEIENKTINLEEVIETAKLSRHIELSTLITLLEEEQRRFELAVDFADWETEVIRASFTNLAGCLVVIANLTKSK